MKALSLDLRKRIVDAYNRGDGSQRALAQRFSVSKASVERLLALYRTTGSVAPKPQRHGPLPTVHEDDFPQIAGWIESQPDLTQEEIALRFTAETGRTVSQRTISRVLRRMQQTRKKSP